MIEFAQDAPMAYNAHLALEAPGALPLRALLEGGAPRVVVTVAALDAFLAARDARGKRGLVAVVASLGDAVPPEARGEGGVLGLDAVVSVLVAAGSPTAAKLVPEIMAAFRDAETAAARAVGGLVHAARIALVGSPSSPALPPSPSAKPVVVLPVPKNLTEHMLAERAAILEALEATRWDRSKAAARLGMPRRTFYRRMEDYGLLEGAKPRGKAAQEARMAAFAAERDAREGKAPAPSPKPAAPAPKAAPSKPAAKGASRRAAKR